MSKNTRILNGYIVVYDPTNEQCMKSENWNGYIYEHIVVAQKLLGRNLNNNEVVHHLDQNRSNNNPENLLILDNVQHVKLHSWLKKIEIKYKEPIIDTTRICLTCGNILNKTQKKYCSEKCVDRNIIPIENKPNKEELISFINNKKSFSEIGRIYNVSGNAVKKWLIKYGLYSKR